MNNGVGLDIREEIRMCITDDTLDIVFPFKTTSVILRKSGTTVEMHLGVECFSFIGAD